MLEKRKVQSHCLDWQLVIVPTPTLTPTPTPTPTPYYFLFLNYVHRDRVAIFISPILTILCHFSRTPRSVDEFTQNNSLRTLIKHVKNHRPVKHIHLACEHTRFRVPLHKSADHSFTDLFTLSLWQTYSRHAVRAHWDNWYWCWVNQFSVCNTNTDVFLQTVTFIF